MSARSTRSRPRLPPQQAEPLSARDELATWAVAAASIVLALVIALRFAEPIGDGDLFWHLAYARQMLEHGTLVPDHTLYSWTPTRNDYVYSSWLAELVLYALHGVAGLPGLFGLRYLIVAGAAALLAGFAWRLGLLRKPLTWFVLLIVVLASHAGTLIKPELFSLLLFHACIFVYFSAKHADAGGRGGTERLFAVPVLVAIWVNVHGAFILLAPFLAATAAGEIANASFSPQLGLSARGRRHLLLAWAACVPAIFLSPYGWRYPAQLVSENILGATARPDVAWNSAYQSFLAGPHLVEFAVVMIAVLSVLIWQVRRRCGQVDWAVLAANVALVPLYVAFIRASYFWPVVFGYSTVYLAMRASQIRPPRTVPRSRLDDPRIARSVASGVLALALLLAVRSAYEARWQPARSSWLGFGIGDDSPVAEAEFLAHAGLGPRLYNLFNGGGYLLWRLYPEYRVMVDSRSFPYLDWFDDQYRFTTGAIFEDFLRRYPADVAIIDLDKDGAWKNFLRSADWRLVYYGPAAAVFARRGLDPDGLPRDVEPDRFAQLRNGGTAARVFDFAIAADDHVNAWAILAIAEKALRSQLAPDWWARAVALRDGHVALARRDFASAQAHFAAALGRRTVGERETQIQTLLQSYIVERQRADVTRLKEVADQLARLAVPPR